MKKCEACSGSGFNPEITHTEIRAPVDIRTPIAGWEAIKAFVERRLLCPTCKGSGNVQNETSKCRCKGTRRFTDGICKKCGGTLL